ncbi:4-coumarate--CoA ligase 3-like isoform X2 [Leguminivora glycinivorella]|uniref:4-coumarate--CoA ligase 3-like isoform X2 n=1 Tax=Leguminivora glycinivorella TaxID=1035111 RepID=UPI00200F9889|nr:4-coumarate--CoA ligase 3-like isoform X2 [Leguminivora glycinivorella]
MPALSRAVRRLLSRQNLLVLSRGQSVWTPDNVVRSPYRAVEAPNRTVVEHVWENLERWPDKVATVCGLTNRSYTYHQLHKQSRNFASQLRTKLGVRDGDVICTMMPNSPEYVVAIVGILTAGAELTTVNPIYTSHEVHRQLLLSKPKIIVGNINTVDVIREAMILAQLDIPIICITENGSFLPNTISFKELTADVDHSVLNDVNNTADDVAILPYSSGTTGLPKGVELTHRNIVTNCVQADVDGVKQYRDTTASHQESIIAVLPFYHIYGLAIITLHKLSVGAKIVTMPKFQPNTFLSTLRDHKISLLYIVPPIGSHPESKQEHLTYVERAVSGAAPLPKLDIDRFIEKCKPNLDFIHLYGLTETSPLVSTTAPGSTNYMTAGFAIPNTELRIVDSEMRNVGPNEVGELLIRGPQVMKGYRDNPEATRNVIDEHGWFRSGDLASLDEQGAVTISDRLKELIKVKGLQVAPAELESVLKEHPSVLDAGVIGVPDERTGEAPKAFIVLRDGHKGDREDIKNFVASRLASFKRLKDVVFIDNLPKNPSGKLLRRVLRDK